MTDCETLKQHLLDQINDLTPILDKQFSLQPDMMFGWMPKFSFRGPIPTFYHSPIIDNIVKNIRQTPQYQIVYFDMHDSLQSEHYLVELESLLPQKQKHLLPIYRQIYLQKLHEQANNRLIEHTLQNTGLKFDSNFESGNLDLAIKISQNEYDLFVRVDTNTNGHIQWFNFKLSGFEDNKCYRINIVNFKKKNNLYQEGMKPYIQKNNGEWKQAEQSIEYSHKPLRLGDNKVRFHQLSFTIQAQSSDNLQVAYCVPYTYSYLLKSLKEKNLLYQSLGQTLSGVHIPLIELGENKQRTIIIQSRIHPGESCGSWMMEGLLQFLSSKNQRNQFLLQNSFIKIVPMVNIDGVIFGNYRSSLAGKDLNRQFLNNDSQIYPETFLIKNLVKQQQKDQLFMFIDLHGHSQKKNSFLYGPQYPIWDKNYVLARILAKYISDKTEMFRYYSCLFRINKDKKSTARAYFHNQYDVANCFTIEASNGIYYSQINQKNFEFNANDWINLGYKIGESLADLVLFHIKIQYQNQLLYNQVNQKSSIKQINITNLKETNSKSINQNRFIPLLKEKQTNYQNIQISKNNFEIVQNSPFTFRDKNKYSNSVAQFSQIQNHTENKNYYRKSKKNQSIDIQNSQNKLQEYNNYFEQDQSISEIVQEIQKVENNKINLSQLTESDSNSSSSDYDQQAHKQFTQMIFSQQTNYQLNIFKNQKYNSQQNTLNNSTTKSFTLSPRNKLNYEQKNVKKQIKIPPQLKLKNYKTLSQLNPSRSQIQLTTNEIQKINIHSARIEKIVKNVPLKQRINYVMTKIESKPDIQTKNTKRLTKEEFLKYSHSNMMKRLQRIAESTNSINQNNQIEQNQLLK